MGRPPDLELARDRHFLVRKSATADLRCSRRTPCSALLSMRQSFSVCPRESGDQRGTRLPFKEEPASRLRGNERRLEQRLRALVPSGRACPGRPRRVRLRAAEKGVNARHILRSGPATGRTGSAISELPLFRAIVVAVSIRPGSRSIAWTIGMLGRLLVLRWIIAAVTLTAVGCVSLTVLQIAWSSPARAQEGFFQNLFRPLFGGRNY